MPSKTTSRIRMQWTRPLRHNFSHNRRQIKYFERLVFSAAFEPIMKMRPETQLAAIGGLVKDGNILTGVVVAWLCGGPPTFVANTTSERHASDKRASEESAFLSRWLRWAHSRLGLPSRRTSRPVHCRKAAMRPESSRSRSTIRQRMERNREFSSRPTSFRCAINARHGCVFTHPQSTFSLRQREKPPCRAFCFGWIWASPEAAY